MSFGQRIKYIRGSLSQDDFAYMLGIHKNTVRAWECDEITPRGGIVKALFMLFNVNLNWLFSGKGEPYLDDLDKPEENASSMPKMNNHLRRQCLRYQSELEVIIFTGGEKISGAFINTGKGGFGLISEKAIRPESQVVMALKSFEESAINGTIKWSSRIKQGQKSMYRMGVEVESFIWNDLKATGFPEWDYLVKKILSNPEKQGKKDN